MTNALNISPNQYNFIIDPNGNPIPPVIPTPNPVKPSAITSAQLLSASDAQITGWVYSPTYGPLLQQTLNTLSASDGSALQPTQISALGAYFAYLSPAALSTLTQSARLKIAAEQVSCMTWSQVWGMHELTGNWRSVTGLFASLGSNFQHLNPSITSQLSLGDIANQAQFMSPGQIAQISWSQVWGSHEQTGSWTQVSNFLNALGKSAQHLSSNLIAQLSTQQIQIILSHLTLPQIGALATNVFAQLSSQMAPMQITGATASQVATMSPTQLNNFFLRLTSPYAHSLSHSDLLAIKTFINAIIPVVGASLTAATVAQISPVLLSSLSDKSPANLNTSLLTGANIAAAGVNFINYLSRAQTTNLNVSTQVTDLFRNLTPASIAQIDPAFFGSLPAASLAVAMNFIRNYPSGTPGQFNSLMSALTDAQVNAIFAQLTTSYVSNLPASATPQTSNLAGLEQWIDSLPSSIYGLLNATTVAAMSPVLLAQLPAANTEQLNVSQMTGQQLLNLGAGFINQINTANLNTAALGTVLTSSLAPRLSTHFFSTQNVATFVNTLIGLPNNEGIGALISLSTTQIGSLSASIINGLVSSSVDFASAILNAGSTSSWTVDQFQAMISAPGVLASIHPSILGNFLSWEALLSMSEVEIAELTDSQFTAILNNPTLAKAICNAGQPGCWTEAQLQAVSAAAVAQINQTQYLQFSHGLSMFSQEQQAAMATNVYLLQIMVTGQTDVWTGDEIAWALENIPGMIALNGLLGGGSNFSSANIPPRFIDLFATTANIAVIQASFSSLMWSTLTPANQIALLSNPNSPAALRGLDQAQLVDVLSNPRLMNALNPAISAALNADFMALVNSINTHIELIPEGQRIRFTPFTHGQIAALINAGEIGMTALSGIIRFARGALPGGQLTAENIMALINVGEIGLTAIARWTPWTPEIIPPLTQAHITALIAANQNGLQALVHITFHALTTLPAFTEANVTDLIAAGENGFNIIVRAAYRAPNLLPPTSQANITALIAAGSPGLRTLRQIIRASIGLPQLSHANITNMIAGGQEGIVLLIEIARDIPAVLPENVFTSNIITMLTDAGEIGYRAIVSIARHSPAFFPENIFTSEIIATMVHAGEPGYRALVDIARYRPEFFPENIFTPEIIATMVHAGEPGYRALVDIARYSANALSKNIFTEPTIIAELSAGALGLSLIFNTSNTFNSLVNQNSTIITGNTYLNAAIPLLDSIGITNWLNSNNIALQNAAHTNWEAFIHNRNFGSAFVNLNPAAQNLARSHVGAYLLTLNPLELITFVQNNGGWLTAAELPPGGAGGVYSDMPATTFTVEVIDALASTPAGLFLLSQLLGKNVSIIGGNNPAQYRNFFMQLTQNTITNLINEASNFLNNLTAIQVASFQTQLEPDGTIAIALANITGPAFAALIGGSFIANVEAVLGSHPFISPAALATLTPAQANLLPIEDFWSEITPAQALAMAASPTLGVNYFDALSRDGNAHISVDALSWLNTNALVTLANTVPAMRFVIVSNWRQFTPNQQLALATNATFSSVLLSNANIEGMNYFNSQFWAVASTENLVTIAGNLNIGGIGYFDISNTAGHISGENLSRIIPASLIGLLQEAPAMQQILEADWHVLHPNQQNALLESPLFSNAQSSPAFLATLDNNQLSLLSGSFWSNIVLDELRQIVANNLAFMTSPNSPGHITLDNLRRISNVVLAEFQQGASLNSGVFISQNSSHFSVAQQSALNVVDRGASQIWLGGMVDQTGGGLSMPTGLMPLPSVNQLIQAIANTQNPVGAAITSPGTMSANPGANNPLTLAAITP